MDVLRAADRSWAANLMGAVFDPGTLRLDFVAEL
jgi:hypothetical protein